ncbi:hypothetical protein [Streptomyces sp. SM1]|uniref:hypothetical protein n=1 Tax=Streptomyces sp. SM1 TaxID=402229 RepID=UPI000CD56FE3|nr:hypothetical protein [Streptomyces sp. SM1]
MKASAFVYPWDVNGDPEAPARIAALGTAQVTLASAYHSTRALTPLCFPRSCKRAAGLRARHDCCPLSKA